MIIVTIVVTTVELLCKDIPEMRTPPLIKTLEAVPDVYSVIPGMRTPHFFNQDSLSCPKGIWNRGVPLYLSDYYTCTLAHPDTRMYIFFCPA